MNSSISKIEYLSIKDIAKCTDIPISTLKLRCHNNCFETRIVKSAGKYGLRYEILVSSLPNELQELVYAALADTDKDLTALHPAEQNQILNQTGGVCPENNNIINSYINYSGFSFKNETNHIIPQNLNERQCLARFAENESSDTGLSAGISCFSGAVNGDELLSSSRPGSTDARSATPALPGNGFLIEQRAAGARGGC